MIEITLKHGVCSYSVIGFVQYAAMLLSKNMFLRSALKIGKVAMSLLLKRYESSDLIPKLYPSYYGLVAIHTEKIQDCTDMLRNAYKGKKLKSNHFSLPNIENLASS